MSDILAKIKENNPFIIIDSNEENKILKKLWDDDAFIFDFDTEEDFSFLIDKYFPPEFSAIYHKDTGFFEFVFTIFPYNHRLLNREIKFIYGENEFNTSFSEPTSVLIKLAKAFKEIDAPGETSYRNLNIIRDYYNRDSLPETLKEFFQDKVAISFFISGPFDKIKDFSHFFKLLNTYMLYYDRDSPSIIIHNISKEEVSHNKPCLTHKNTFPNKLIVNDIDETALELFHVAKNTQNVRLQYIFNYQVIEYYAYYFINDSIRKNINNIITYPDFIYKSEHYSKLLLEELRDGINKDKERFSACIKHYISIEDIKDELEANIDFFKNDIVFDGGYNLNAIIKDSNFYEKLKIESDDNLDIKKNKNKLKEEIFDKIADRLDRIRNVLVHVREMREKSAIAPTESNDNKLIPYYYLIRRIAEIIAIKYRR